MARDAKVDLWIDEHGIERPYQHLLNVGFIGAKTANGATVGIYLRYKTSPTDPQDLELRFHVPVETARQIAAQLQSYAGLAEHQMPAPTPTKPN